MRIISTAVAAAFCVAVAQIVTAAQIKVVPASPGNTPGDAFDVSKPGIIYGVDNTTLFNPAGYDIRDLFGGQFDSYAPERGNVVFADNRTLGTVSTIFVTLPTPIILTGYSLVVAEDGGANTGTGFRGMREFKLLAGGTLVSDVHVLNNTGTQTYLGVYGGTALNVSDTFADAPSTTQYTLQFIQNQGANVNSGVRVIEFDAVVPEPASLSLFAFGSLSLLARRCRK